MYAASAGRVTSTNTFSCEQENTDIPEWKKLLIMKRRSATHSSVCDESKTAASQTRSHFRGPLKVSTNEPNLRRVGLTGSCNSNSGQTTCEISAPGHVNKFSAVCTSDVDNNGRERAISSPASISSSESSRTITIGNINVELRNVSKSSASLSDSPEVFRSEDSVDNRFPTSPLSDVYQSDEEDEDLQYGPGIVDRLRARFLNIGRAKNNRQPVVRKFSSLENLSPRGNIASGLPLRATGTQARRYGIRAGAAGQRCYVKKAQSMETLLVGEMLASGRINSHPFPKTVSNSQAPNLPLSPFFCQNDIVDSDKQYLSNTVDKTCRRWEYARQISAPNINEDELPKPDTVKQVKRIFESPYSEKSCHSAVSHRNVSNSLGGRPFRGKQPGVSSPTSPNKIVVKTNSQVKRVAPKTTSKCNDHIAKNSAKIDEETITNCKNNNNDISLKILNNKTDENFTSSQSDAQTDADEDQKEQYEINEEKCYESEIKSANDLFISSDLSSGNVPETFVSPPNDVVDDLSEFDAKCSNILIQNLEEGEEGDNIESTKVIAEQLPLIAPEQPSGSEEQSQGSQVSSEAEQIVANTQEEPHPISEHQSSLGGMVVASSPDPSDGNGSSDAVESGEMTVPFKQQTVTKKGPGWKKPPAATTSVVFDFRGKDVKPNISLNPAPFGCRPARITRNALGRKRAGSPPRSPVKVNGVDGAFNNNCNDDDDWDEMDIGADLPAISGIVFTGENVKVGRGALLEKRNKKLTIQFDDDATSTFEYPSENAFSPCDENSPPSNDQQNPNLMDYSRLAPSSSLKSSFAIGTSANSGLSSYTPHVLSSNVEFQLGVSRPVQRHSPTDPIKCESPITVLDEIVPANPGTTPGWSATETTDILF